MSDKQHQMIDRLSGELPPTMADSVDESKYLDYLREKQRPERKGLRHHLSRPFIAAREAISRRGEQKRQREADWKEARKAEASRSEEEAKRVRLANLEGQILGIALEPLRKRFDNFKTMLERKERLISAGIGEEPDEIIEGINSMFFSRDSYSPAEGRPHGLPEKINILLNSATLQKSPYIDTLSELAFEGEGAGKVDEYAREKGISTDEAKTELDLKIAKAIISEYMKLKSKILGVFGDKAPQQSPLPKNRPQIEI